MDTKVNNKIYIGHLPFQTKEDDIRNLFSPFGEIITITIPTEANSDRELGYAFVEFDNEQSADKAVKAMDGKEFHGRLLKVNIAKHTRCRGRW